MLFLSAGEVSGDVYGAELLEALQTLAPELTCYGLGGSTLKKKGQQQLAQVLHRSAVGLTENIPHLHYFKNVLIRVKRWLHRFRPRAVILVDFQGLNLQIGTYARKLGIPVFYFIAPQAWIWHMPGDLKRISRSCDLLLSVFKPEHEFYLKHGLKSKFVGHPLIDTLDALAIKTSAPSAAPSICWLPGSRPLEIKRLAKPLSALIRHALDHPEFRHYQHTIPIADAHLEPLLRSCFQHLPIHWIAPNKRYTAMKNATGIIGASGSAILEAALLNKPTIALYKVSPLTFALAKSVVKTPWITLPNLLLGHACIPEFLQHFSTPAIFNRFEDALLQHPNLSSQLKHQMSPDSAQNTAAERASQCILEYI